MLTPYMIPSQRVTKVPIHLRIFAVLHFLYAMYAINTQIISNANKLILSTAASIRPYNHIHL
jgi:hypothetical protein